MIDYAATLKANPSGVMATQDNGKIKTRVFQYLFSDGNKAYFCTSNEKQVYEQIKANPYVSFCTYPANFAPVLSLNGKAVFVSDIALKTRTLDENPAIKGIYNTPDNPAFEMFYIAVEEVKTFSFTEGPKTYTI